MDPLLIPVIGLAVALLAALWAMRRRADEVADLRRRLRDAGVEHPSAPAAAPAPEPGVLELLPVGVLVLDRDGRISSASARAHTLLGVAPGRLDGRTLIEAFLDVRVERLVASLAPGGAASTELRASDGEQRQLLVRATRTGDGPVVLVLEDVTELRRLQQIRTEFIDNLSHELRTPLSTVSLLAETLAREAAQVDVPGRMRERIAKIEVETGHLVQMVSELLDLARIEGGSQLRLEEDVDLGRLAEASAERLRLFAERQGVQLVVDAAPGIPAVRGDEARLGQVLVNLVHNAVKFSPDGGEVRVEVRGDDDGVEVSVVDHGIGIPEADRARVFERFYKVDRARVRGGGTGLGLSIARHVVQGHGGRIWVESEDGRGSTFRFVVPRLPGEPPGGASPPTGTTPGARPIA